MKKTFNLNETKNSGEILIGAIVMRIPVAG